MIIIAVTATNSIAKVCFSWKIAKKKMRYMKKVETVGFVSTFFKKCLFAMSLVKPI